MGGEHPHARPCAKRAKNKQWIGLAGVRFDRGIPSVTSGPVYELQTIELFEGQFNPLVLFGALQRKVDAKVGV